MKTCCHRLENLCKCSGALDSPNGRQANWNSLFCHMKRRYAWLYHWLYHRGDLHLRIPVTQVQIGESAVPVSKSARNIGVIFDSTLSLKSHVNQVCRKSYFQLRNLGKLRQFFTQSSLEQLVHSFVTSQFDYCNSLFLGLPKSQVQQLQRIQNTAARIASGRRKYDQFSMIFIGFQLTSALSLRL